MTGDTATDSVLLSAVDFARDAVTAEADASQVGEHIGAVMEDERLVAHSFQCLNPAYLGWQWTVTLTRATADHEPTIIDVVLLPGDGAIVPPAWKPWSDRVQAGDLGAGDVLPTPRDDARLVAGLTGSDDLEGLASQSPLSPSQWEIGLGRVRVLSAWGRDDAADRWQNGDFGPVTAMARQAAHECATCGFMLPVGGPVGQLFGLCANAMSPADGRVVSLAFGCGAHSEVEIEPDAIIDEGPTIDDVDFDTIDAALVAVYVEPVVVDAVVEDGVVKDADEVASDESGDAASTTDDIQAERDAGDESDDSDTDPPAAALIDEPVVEEEQDEQP